MPFKYIDRSINQAASKHSAPADGLGAFGALPQEVRNMIWARCIYDDNSIATFRTSKGMYHNISSQCDPKTRKSTFTIELHKSIPAVVNGGIHLEAKVYDGAGSLVQKWPIEPRSYHVFVKEDSVGEHDCYYGPQFRPLHNILKAQPTMITILVPPPAAKDKFSTHYSFAALQIDEILLGLKAELKATGGSLPALHIHFVEPPADDTIWGSIATIPALFQNPATRSFFSLYGIFKSLKMITNVPKVTIKLPNAVAGSVYWNEQIEKARTSMERLELNDLEQFQDVAELGTPLYQESKITPNIWKGRLANMVTSMSDCIGSWSTLGGTCLGSSIVGWRIASLLDIGILFGRARRCRKAGTY